MGVCPRKHRKKRVNHAGIKKIRISTNKELWAGGKLLS
jgi:hypothetical protein